MNPTVGECLLRKKNNFDFIRLIASIAVIFSHAFPLTNSGEEPLAAISNYHFSLGGLSVMTFFVISGFLITRSFSRAHSVSEYFLARALRIYPALFVVIVLSAFILGPVFSTQSISSYFADIKTYKYLTNIAALRIQNSLPGVFHYNPFPDFVNGSLWSLPAEILCYALVATAGLFAGRRFKFALILSAIVGVYIYFHPHHFVDDHYYPNIFFFFLGGCFYILKDKIVINYKGAILMLLLFLVSLKTPGAIPFMIVGGISYTYLLLYVGFIRNSPVENITKYGDFSYGLYIWAFPVQQVLALRFPNWGVYTSFLVAFFITSLLAILSWHLIEKRAMAYKSLLKRKAVLQPELSSWSGQEPEVQTQKIPIS